MNDLGCAEGVEAVDVGNARWISAVWLLGCLAAMHLPKALRHRIFASTRLRARVPKAVTRLAASYS